MQSFSVFGDALNPGDPFRRQMDPTGFMAKLIQNMPHANAFNASTGPYVTTTATATAAVNAADGLNIGTYRWVRRTIGGAGGSGASSQDEFNRRQINVKIDHNFNPHHKLTGSYAQEYRYDDNAAVSPWPNGWGGEINTSPKVGNLQFTSTFSSNVLNEFRYSYRNTNLEDKLAIANHDPKIQKAAYDFLTKINDIPVIQKPTLFPDHMIVCPGDLTCSNRGNRSPLTGYADTFSWTKGPHAMKFGGEFRFAHSFSWSPQNIIPTVFGRIRDWHQNEISFFMKDDWRITPNLTLNLGMRYDLFRVPYLVSASGAGFTPGLEGGNDALYGYSGRGIGSWMSGGTPQRGALTKTILIGKDTAHPNQGIWP